jgi:ParB/RepB/Spo0J family partition protein
LERGGTEGGAESASSSVPESVSKQEAPLPKPGDRIPIDKFFVSKTNMRSDEPFGEDPEDQALIEHLRHTGIVQPFKARPEGDGYGVFVGRRRFLALKASGLKEATVGKHVWIEEASEEEAMEASLKENLEEFHRIPDPVTRAKAIKAYMERLPRGLRDLSRAWGIAASTLSEYLKVLELSEAMQSVLKRGIVSFRDALAVARLGLDEADQNRLAAIAGSEGLDAFKKELARLMEGRGKRGIPAGVYAVVRSIFDKRSEEDARIFEGLRSLARQRGMEVSEYAKQIIVEHVKEAMESGSEGKEG